MLRTHNDYYPMQRMNFFCLLQSSKVKFYLCLVLCMFLPACVRSSSLSLSERVARTRKIEFLLTKGTFFLRQRDAESIARAEAAFKLVTVLDSREARAVDGLGAVAWHRKDFELAKSFFKRAIDINAHYDRPYAHLALIAQQEGDLVTAHRLFQQAMTLNPLNYRSRNNFAALLANNAADTAQMQVAYDEILKAEHLSPKNQPVVKKNVRRIGLALQQ